MAKDLMEEKKVILTAMTQVKEELCTKCVYMCH